MIVANTLELAALAERHVQVRLQIADIAEEDVAEEDFAEENAKKRKKKKSSNPGAYKRWLQEHMQPDDYTSEHPKWSFWSGKLGWSGFAKASCSEVVSRTGGSGGVCGLPSWRWGGSGQNRRSLGITKGRRRGRSYE